MSGAPPPDAMYRALEAYLTHPAPPTADALARAVEAYLRSAGYWPAPS